MRTKKTKKKVTVNRKFLMRLADDIYNPKTKSFLRLCDGMLQNGPDPTNKKRPMHCGLGELYFAMTGQQPNDDNVSEKRVIDLAVELSTLPDIDVLREEAHESVEAMGVSRVIKDQMIDLLDSQDDGDFSELEITFREALSEIPSENDDGCGDACSMTSFRKRSWRVAAKLREAAKLLPA